MDDKLGDSSPSSHYFMVRVTFSVRVRVRVRVSVRVSVRISVRISVV